MLVHMQRRTHLEQFLLLVVMVAACAGKSRTETKATEQKLSPTLADASAPVLPPGRSFIAAAPRGFSLNHLGKPYTADFVPLQGAEGRSLFPDAGPPSVSPQAYMEHAFVFADSEEVLAANASAWNLALGYGARTSRRFASYRAVQVGEVHEIDDTSPIRPSNLNAVYYPWKVYLGHSYEVLLEGDEAEFHSGARADLLAASAGVDDFARRHHLSFRAVGYGLRPTSNKAIFARTQDEIRAHYAAESDRAVPILVEWREIPGRRANVTPIAWTSLQQGCAGQKGCEPCEEWEFSYIEWQLPESDPSGNKWDSVHGLPDAVLTLRVGIQEWKSPEKNVYLFKWKLPTPVRIRAGTSVSLSAVDRDELGESEFMGSLRVRIGEFHEEQGTVGKVYFENGRAFMTGRCIRP